MFAQPGLSCLSWSWKSSMPSCGGRHHVSISMKGQQRSIPINSTVCTWMSNRRSLKSYSN